jgi:hypothetical protein
MSERRSGLMQAISDCWADVRGIMSDQLFALAVKVAPDGEKASAHQALHDHASRVIAMRIDDETDRAGA